jgi:ATP-binding cassette subfamily B protein
MSVIMELLTLQPAKTPWSFLWTIIKPYKWGYLLIVQAPLFTSLYFFCHNYALKLLVDIFSKEPSFTHSNLIFPILLFLGAQIGMSLLSRLSEITQARIEPAIRKKLWGAVYNYVQHHSHQFFKNTSGGLVLSKIRGVVEGYDVLVASTTKLIARQLTVVCVSILSLAIIEWKVFLFVVGWCGLFLFFTLPLSLKMNQFSSQLAESKHKLMGHMADNLMNIFSLFYFSKHQFELNRLNHFLTQHYVPAQKALYHHDLKFNLRCNLLYWLMLVSIFLLMIYFRERNLITNGDFIFVMTTTLAISYDLTGLMSQLSVYIKQIADFKSAFEILKSPHEQIDNEKAKPKPILKGSIEFRNVTFAYEKNAAILDNLSFIIDSGEKIGIVGPSGAGKSTLISLLLKSVNPTHGEIFIDEASLENITQASVCEQVAYIPQEVHLFNRSLAENIGYANEHATQEAIEHAAKLAHLHDYILSLPNQYQTIVGERGLKLSGGQRQRIALARAFLKKAPIMIFDEATASLDLASEFFIQKALEEEALKTKATVIVIAHRLSTIKNMDKILVIKDGRLLEQGSFQALRFQKHSYFNTLWQHQTKEEMR